MRTNRAYGRVKMSGIKILVAEDNPQNMRLIEMILRRGGYELLKAVNGDEALNMAMEEHPDLVIMDMGLPKISGLEVTRTLRRMPSFDDVSILAVTAHAMKGDEDKFIKAGCDSYLSKPVRIVAGMLEKKRCRGGWEVSYDKENSGL